MEFRTVDYPNMPELIISPGTIQLNTDLAILIKTYFEDYIGSNSNLKFPKNYYTLSVKSISKMLSNYLRQINKPFLRQRNASFGFQLKAFDEKLKASEQNTPIQKSRGNSSSTVLDLIDNGNYKWVYQKYKWEVIVEPGKYKTFQNFVIIELIEPLVNINEGPEGWNDLKNKSEKSVSFIDNVVYRFVKVVNHNNLRTIKFPYRWKLEKI